MKTPGQIARAILGPAFEPVGRAYRRFFVDMPKIADWMAARLPSNANVLDVGGGDGFVVDLLLSRKPYIRVTMTDIASEIGSFITPANRCRVTILSRTRASEVQGNFDAITLADVIHHVPLAIREAFFADIANAAEKTGVKTILIKDVHPSGVRAKLGLWADRYITGDKAVVLAREGDIKIPGFRRAETAMPDFPNYCIRFERG